MAARPFLPARSALPVAVLVLLSTIVRAQDSRFSTSTDLVLVSVRVVGADKQPRSRLTKAAFTIFDNGRPQTIDLFESEDAPATVGLIIDNSTSMLAIRQRIIDAATAFASASHPADELFALTFDDVVRPVLEPGAPFSHDVPEFRRALTGAIHPRGRTALFDATIGGLSYAARGSHPRSVLVVMSDGGDNASEATFDDVLAEVRRSNTVIYTVAIVDPLASDARPRRLADLAKATGGRAFTPRGPADIGAALETIASDIRHVYTLGYVPDATSGAGYHRIRVDVVTPDRRKVLVTAREGYSSGERRSHAAP